LTKNNFGKGLSAFLLGSPEEEFWTEGLSSTLHLIEEAMTYTLRNDWQVQVDAPSTTVINLMEKRMTGSTLLHLINFETARRVQEVSVELRKPADKSLKEVLLLSPDFKETETLQAEEDAKAVSFTVPRLEIYDLFVIDWK